MKHTAKELKIGQVSNKFYVTSRIRNNRYITQEGLLIPFDSNNKYAYYFNSKKEADVAIEIYISNLRKKYCDAGVI